MTPHQLSTLTFLTTGHKTALDLTPKQLSTIQHLVGKGLVRDYGQQLYRRVEVRLRIWGITQAGRTALKQVEMGKKVTGRNLFDHQRWASAPKGTKP